MSNDILRTLSTFVRPGGVVEIRTIGGRGRPTGGYFDDLERAADVAHKLDQAAQNDGVYFTLNPVNPDLLARYCNKMCQGKSPELTKATDVIHRDWLLVDVDVNNKTKGISSRDSEHEEALAEAAKLANRMTRDYNWPDPIKADSGNGAHLIYKIDLPNDTASTELVKNTLAALDFIFHHDRLKIDTAPHDPNRICKLYGTTTRKGDELKDRRHRQAKLLDVPNEIETVSEQQLKVLVGLYESAVGPKEEPVYQPSSRGDIDDMSAWLREHGLSYGKTKSGGTAGSTIYILDDCPGCHDTRGSCEVEKFGAPRNGQHATCHHETCSIKTWPDFRKIVDPGFYEKRPSRQERDQVRRERPNMPDLALEDLCLEETKGFGDKAVVSWKFSPDKAADAIIQRWDIVSTRDGRIWVYDGGFFDSGGWIAIDGTVDRIAADEYDIKASRELKRKVFLRTLIEDNELNKNPYLLCCKNKTINLQTGEILEHSPAHYLTYQLPVTYDQSATCPAFIDFLEDITPNELDRITLIDIMVTLLVRKPFPFAYFILGLGRNGKGIYEEVIRALFGLNGAVRTMPPSEMSKNNFAKGYLEGAYACITSEEEGDEGKMVIGTGLIKLISGNGVIDSDVKNKDRKMFQAFCQFLTFTNNMPFIKDQSIGWKERFVKIDLPYIFVENPKGEREKKKDPHLIDSLTKELPGILNLLLYRAKAVVPEMKIAKRDGAEMFAEYLKQSNSLQTFWDLYCEYNPDYYEADYCTEDLYENYYIPWCQHNTADQAAQNAFGAFLKKKMGRRDAIKKFYKGYDIRKTGYRGLIFDSAKHTSDSLDSVCPGCPGSVRVSKKEVQVVDSDCPGCPSCPGDLWIRLHARMGARAHAHVENFPKKPGQPGQPGQTVSSDLSKVEENQDMPRHQPGHKGLVCLRITKDCEHAGKSYSFDDVVNVPPEVAKNLFGTVVKQFDTCSACGKYMKPHPRSDRSLCGPCFQEIGDQEASSRHTESKLEMHDVWQGA